MHVAHDELLLERWRREQDQEALVELLSSRRTMAYALARRITGNAADAEDAVQDAFLKVFSSPPCDLAGVRALDDALLRAVTNRCRNLMRGARRRKRREYLAGRVTEPARPSQEPKETSKALLEIIRDLPEAERVMVVLCYQEGLTVKRAAEILGLARQTLAYRLARCRKRIRGKLRQRGFGVSIFGLTYAIRGALRLEAAAAAAGTVSGKLSGPGVGFWSSTK